MKKDDEININILGKKKPIFYRRNAIPIQKNNNNLIKQIHTELSKKRNEKLNNYLKELDNIKKELEKVTSELQRVKSLNRIASIKHEILNITCNNFR
uniref:Uncharacterized protein n=1 Tax=viral metagenome TaxID=1070528 RepID=A0A6C0BSX0_9ZZZZ